MGAELGGDPPSSVTSKAGVGEMEGGGSGSGGSPVNDLSGGTWGLVERFAEGRGTHGHA